MTVHWVQHPGSKCSEQCFRGNDLVGWVYVTDEGIEAWSYVPEYKSKSFDFGPDAHESARKWVSDNVDVKETK